VEIGGHGHGDKLVSEGYFIPQTDGTLLFNLSLVPKLSTGRFAGATGAFTDLRPVPEDLYRQGHHHPGHPADPTSKDPQPGRGESVNAPVAPANRPGAQFGNSR